MIDLTIRQHLGVLIGSINKLYNKAKIEGVLNAKDIYYLNTLYRIIDNIELTPNEYKNLITLYTKFSFCSDNICPIDICKTYSTAPSNNFEVADPTDCNDFPMRNEILYWQEDYTLDNDTIRLILNSLNYLNDKPSDTYSNFEIGKDIDYTKIGKLIFLALESNNTNYKVLDAYNNDVTHTFNIQVVNSLNATLFISDNIYSYGNINFKIQKL